MFVEEGPRIRRAPQDRTKNGSPFELTNVEVGRIVKFEGGEIDSTGGASCSELRRTIVSQPGD